MSEKNEHSGRHNPLVDEAADWFAKMRGPDADQFRTEFELWLGRGALHRAAYNRVAGIFAMGKAIEADEPPLRATSGKASRKRSGRGLVAAFFLFAVVLGAGVILMGIRGPGPSASPHPGTAGLIGSPKGRISTTRLADGSQVTLDAGSRLAFALDGEQRSLWLLQGRARFDVAHDGRPFRVHAGSGTVVARGTLFDVALLAGHAVEVKLLRGKVDVVLDRTPSMQAGSAPIRRLLPGRTVIFSAQFMPRTNATADIGGDWPSGIIDVHGVPLSRVLEEASRYGPLRLTAADEKVAALKVSGRFSLADPVRLAGQLALLFGLSINRSEDGELILSRPAERAPQE